MAIFRGTTIRGQQITDLTIDKTKLANGTLTDVQIASDAAIAEGKLNINWHSHKEVLEDRKIVDFVQVNGVDVIGTEVDLEAAIPSLIGIASANSVGNVEGIVIDGPKNIAPMRDAISGEPLVAEISGVEYEVIARMEQNAGKYVLKFYTTSGVDGAEVPYAVPATKVDFQYARRFNLSTVDEMFAANEKFVHGAADITASLDLQQLASDLYGASGTLDRDGHANLSKSLVEQLADEVSRAQTAESGIISALAAETTNRTNADSNLQSEIDILNGNNAVVGSVDNKIKLQVIDVLASTADGQGASTVSIAPIVGLDADNVQGALEFLKTNAGDALTTFKSDLGSDVAGKGASLIAVEAGKFGSLTNVEAVLENHDARIETLETEVGAALVRAESANKYFGAVTFADVAARFADDEAVVDANIKRIDDRDLADRTRVATANNVFAAGVKAKLVDRFADIETVVDADDKELKDARGSKATLNERLSVALRADGQLVDDSKIHVHRKYTLTLAANQSQVMLPVGEKFNISSGAVAQNSAQVYVNGILQSNGINFSEVADGVDATKGIGVDFTPEELVAGDVVVIEWVVNNAN